MPLQYRVEWTTTGGPGFTVFNGRQSAATTIGEAAQDLADRARKFYQDLISLMPADVLLNFPGEVLNLNTTTGVLDGVVPVDAPDPVDPAGTGVYAAPCGARIDWITEAVVAGHRLRGRTFVVPIVAALYEADGTIGPTAVASLNTAATNYRDDGVFTAIDPAVWSRTHGVLADITGHQVPQKVATLRSRRD